MPPQGPVVRPREASKIFWTKITSMVTVLDNQQPKFDGERPEDRSGQHLGLPDLLAGR